MTQETQIQETAEASTELTAEVQSTGLVGVNLNVPGMEGLELDFGSVPLVKLDKGEFIVSGADFQLESPFHAIIYSARPKYFYKCSDETNPIPFFYSYDQSTTTNGESVDDILNMWTQAGASSKVSKYLEVLALLADQQEFVLLSVSPRSIGRFSRYIGLDLPRLGFNDPRQVVTEVGIGPRVEARFPFRPWDFRFHCSVDDYNKQAEQAEETEEAEKAEAPAPRRTSSRQRRS